MQAGRDLGPRAQEATGLHEQIVELEGAVASASGRRLEREHLEAHQQVSERVARRLAHHVVARGLGRREGDSCVGDPIGPMRPGGPCCR